MTVRWDSMPCMDTDGRILVAEVRDLDLQAWEAPDGVAWSVQRAGVLLADGCIREVDGRAVYEPADSTVGDVENVVDRSRWLRAAQSLALGAACRIVREDALALQRLAAELSHAAATA